MFQVFYDFSSFLEMARGSFYRCIWYATKLCTTEMLPSSINGFQVLICATEGISHFTGIHVGTTLGNPVHCGVPTILFLNDSVLRSLIKSICPAPIVHTILFWGEGGCLMVRIWWLFSLFPRLWC